MLSQNVAGQSKVGCRFPRWLSSAAHWHSLDTVRAPEVDHSAAAAANLNRAPRRVSRVSMSVSSANASFIDLRVHGNGGNGPPAYYGQDEEEGSTVLCHKREKMTTVGERVVRLILYQTKGW